MSDDPKSSRESEKPQYEQFKANDQGGVRCICSEGGATTRRTRQVGNFSRRSQEIDEIPVGLDEFTREMKVEVGAVNGAVTPLTRRMDKLESNLVERLQTLRKEVVRSDLMQLNDTLRKLNSDAVQMTGPDLRTLQAPTNQLSTKLNELGEQLRDFLRAMALFNVTTLGT